MAWQTRALVGQGRKGELENGYQADLAHVPRSTLGTVIAPANPLSRLAPVFAMPCNGPFVKWWRGNTHAFGEDFGGGVLYISEGCYCLPRPTYVVRYYASWYNF
jgi:hypothetical protein